MTVLDDLPGVAAKGRTRISDQVRNGPGRWGRWPCWPAGADLERRLHSLRTERALRPPAGAPPTEPAPGPAGRPPVAPREPSAAPGPSSSDSAPPSPPTGPRAPEAATVGPVDQAIPGYDTLSASQVVRRLDSLGPDELAAVHAPRGRHPEPADHPAPGPAAPAGPPGAPRPRWSPGTRRPTARPPATPGTRRPTARPPATPGTRPTPRPARLSGRPAVEGVRPARPDDGPRCTELVAQARAEVAGQRGGPQLLAGVGGVRDAGGHVGGRRGRPPCGWGSSTGPRWGWPPGCSDTHRGSPHRAARVLLRRAGGPRGGGRDGPGDGAGRVVRDPGLHRRGRAWPSPATAPPSSCSRRRASRPGCWSSTDRCR